MVVGRGSFTEAFPLFHLNLRDYDKLFYEKLELLLAIRERKSVSWSGQFRPSLHNQPICPRPLQDSLSILLGVGGTPASFVPAGILSLPLVIAVIAGETYRFRPFIDLYREAGGEAGQAPDKLKVGLHSLGYVAETSEKVVNEYFPGYAEACTRIGREKGWPPVTRNHFNALKGPYGALIVGNPEEVA